MRVAFLGLGHMGLPMARNLARSGADVVAYDVVPAARETATSAGLTVAASGAEAVRYASVVLTMFPEGRHVLGAYRDELLSAASAGALFIECSTISVVEAEQAHALAVEAGFRQIDAPVSGGVVGAENATLAFMVGGESADVDAARPLLGAMGQRIVHCGGAGLGQAAKVCNNMILAVSQIAVAEAFVMAERMGLDDQVLYDVVSNASGQCWAMNVNCPVPGPVPTSPANRDYAPGFASTLMAKDLGLALSAMEATGTNARMGRLAEEVYARFAAGEDGGLDFSAVIRDVRAASAPSL